MSRQQAARNSGPGGTDSNPFEDPAVLEHSTEHREPALNQLYNPFDGGREYAPIKTTPLPPPQPPEQPAVCQNPRIPTEHRSYGTQKPTTMLTADLLRQQEELEKKAAELDRKEKELQNTAISSSISLNNWPPLPSFCPVKPCFYHDIKADIPRDFQKTVSVMYYLWMLSSVVLFLNLLGSLAWFTVHVEAGTHFGLSILWLLLFTPCSFVCWYRPLYKAFRTDSSFNFFSFFFVFFVQDITFVLQTVGIPGWGFCGWISSLSALKSNVGVGVVMMMVSVLFTASAVLGVVMLKRVHSLYRRTGASFQKAQEELAAGVMSNPAMRNAAGAAAGAAAQNAFQRN
ncbi:secretory carrier-associated membrane protein 3-like [Chiloscyllium punctatum]|uniref:secretory carrier-associated membrane protein 3-like n=1 Tax=Chiloscyllium punctatum TaxID=137246 RepID=UPI003B63A700